MMISMWWLRTVLLYVALIIGAAYILIGCTSLKFPDRVTQRKGLVLDSTTNLATGYYTASVVAMQGDSTPTSIGARVTIYAYQRDSSIYVGAEISDSTRIILKRPIRYDSLIIIRLRDNYRSVDISVSAEGAQ